MDRIEEVKRVLDETIANYEEEWRGEWIDRVAHQICQLFEPKPDAKTIATIAQKLEDAGYMGKTEFYHLLEI